MELMSQSKCAGLLKPPRSRQYLNKLIKAGKIPVHENNQVYLEEVQRILVILAQPGRDPQREHAAKQRQAGRNDEWGDSKFYKRFGTATNAASDLAGLGEQERLARILKEQLQAQMLEIELAEKRRELISLDEAMEVNDRVAGEIRSALVSLPSKMAPSLEGLKASKIKHVLEDEVNDILKKLHGLGEGLSE